MSLRTRVRNRRQALCTEPSRRRRRGAADGGELGAAAPARVEIRIGAAPVVRVRDGARLLVEIPAKV